MTKDVYIEGIGNIKLRKGRNFRNLRISVRPFNRISVSVPHSFSFSEAEKFVSQKEDWIKRSLEKFKKIENKQTLFDENTEFKTREHKLKILRHDGSTIKLIIKNKVIYVFFPSYADVKDIRIQKAIRTAIIEAWRIEAKNFLPERVFELACKFRFKYNSVSVKNAGTRWGSCSSSNNINLNVQLMRLPAHLCDYIILHELAHTVEKNHGKEFWALLNKVTGDAKALDKEVKNFNLNVW